MIKVGLIGAGAIGYFHLSGYENNSNCELIAIASRTEKSAKLAAKKFGVPNTYWGENWKIMLEKEDLDVVSICSPNYLHAEMTLEALKNDVNVLCEKPIALTKKELDKIEEVVKTSGLIYFTAFQKRYNPIVPYLKKIVEEKILGDLTYVRYNFSHLGPYTSWKPLSDEKWFFDADKAGGGVLLDLGVHCIDILRHLIGEFTSVEWASFNTSCKKIQHEDNGIVLFRFINNALGIVYVSWCNEPHEIIEIFGTNGILRIDLHTNDLLLKPKEIKQVDNVKALLSFETPEDYNTQNKLIDHFIECVKENKQESPDFQDGKRAVEFVLDAYSKQI